MSLLVIGAGLPRSGTTSLKEALRILGTQPAYTFSDFTADDEQVSLWDERRFRRVLLGYQAALDYPACCYWRGLALAFPQSKVILTVRDPRVWWESAMATIYPATRDRVNRQCGALAGDLWDREFGGRFEDFEVASLQLRSRERAVRRVLSVRRRLIFDVAQGWEPLCEFLNRPVPDEPFPFLNARGTPSCVF